MNIYKFLIISILIWPFVSCQYIKPDIVSEKFQKQWNKRFKKVTIKKLQQVNFV